MPDPPLPIEMEGGYSPQELFETLLRVASRGDSIEHTAKCLEGLPTGNGIRYHLNKLVDMSTLEEQALQSQIPPKVSNGKHRVAIDLNLLPYYGNASEVEDPYIYRSQAKSGTTSFFAYATIYVISRNQRVTLGIHAVSCRETLVATVTYLLAMLYPLQVRVKRLYLDRGFYSVPVIRLQTLNIPFIMPAVIRGKIAGTRQLLVGHKSYVTRYTLNSPHYGSVTCQMRVICTYHKGFKGQHGIHYFVYVVYRVKVSLHQIHHHYRERFGIETSYRIKNYCRIRTSTKHPAVRLLFVALAFILVNLWIYLLWCFVIRSRRGGRLVYRELFNLKTMLEFLSHAVERQFPFITIIYLPSLE
ncbi:transposase [Tumidithrix elongata RA019]|uniref:Transposase n=1 Tax=Tumidithrix elongata BACA0141 TaxID=2716417 RepID=A0AAW9Q2J0_9CYAN|nr:transposase [Tumidithrix elongata RA019]